MITIKIMDLISLLFCSFMGGVVMMCFIWLSVNDEKAEEEEDTKEEEKPTC